MASTVTFAAIPTKVAISPQGAAWKIGSKQQFSVTCTYSDGSTDNCAAAGGATWSVSRNAANMTVSTKGLATWVAAGTVYPSNNEGFVIVTAGGMSDKAGTFGQQTTDTFYVYITPDYRNYKDPVYGAQLPLNIAV